MDRRSFVIGTAASTHAASPVRAQGAYPTQAITMISSFPHGFNKAAHGKRFLDTLENLGQELAYMDQPEFA